MVQVYKNGRRTTVCNRESKSTKALNDNLKSPLRSNKLLNLFMGQAFEALQQVVNLSTKRSAT